MNILTEIKTELLSLHNWLDMSSSQPARERICELINRIDNAQECDTTESTSISEPLVSNNNAEVTECLRLIPVDDTDSFPKDKEFYVLFDNGEIAKFYGDEHPFAIATHYFRAKPEKTTLYSSPVGGGVRVKIEYKDHDKIVLTNCKGDTYTSKSEELMDFFHGLEESVSPVVKDDWISVEGNGYPEKSGKYLVFSNDYHKVGHGWFNKPRWADDGPEQGYWMDDKEEPLFVTHWRPLPAPPETNIISPK